ncbi:LytTR family two component transcriptional regulator [Mucilaginibacter yixingensis]|uniref:LytTR family two component transcriptional regulator n=1 Tax=Mucilaginibacter yixingensis TaxID=1295612 RepID=A0A2T5JEK1_9SPHI|nr:LytTR family DNA-binding domain-containing protein [Mucilaginibacter yixingensis]PTR00853.1 LytTR family two component transcriptional regulator [Mucilaginibacter yixingensis]
MKLNCIIIDDEPMARKLLQEYIEEIDFLELAGTAENPLKVGKLLSENTVDLIFLDINMPRINGMDFLRSSVNLPMVIMTTAYGQYALDGFELSVVDYLVKPFSLERFLKASQKALELKTLRQKPAALPSTAVDHFFVKADGIIEKICYRDLLYAEGMANYVVLYTAQSKHIVYLTIKALLEQLPIKNFMQVHKSSIVNVDHVKAVEGNMLHVADRKLSIGPNYQSRVMEVLLNGKLLKR